MNHLDAALVARSYRAGHALRSASLRHRRLIERPLGIVLWQLAGEPFSAAALGWGDRAEALEMRVGGEPRNRDLAFAALLPFARWFNVRFEAHFADCEEFTRGDFTVRRARTAPQVLVANGATVEVLGTSADDWPTCRRPGRRLPMKRWCALAGTCVFSGCTPRVRVSNSWSP